MKLDPLLAKWEGVKLQKRLLMEEIPNNHLNMYKTLQITGYLLDQLVIAGFLNHQQYVSNQPRKTCLAAHLLKNNNLFDFKKRPKISIFEKVFHHGVWTKATPTTYNLFEWSLLMVHKSGQAVTFVERWIFVLCVLPWILDAVFHSRSRCVSFTPM